MKIKILRTLVAAVMLLGSLFFVQADDKKAGKDPRAEKFRAAEEKIWGAVKAGKLSKEAASKKLAGLKKEIWGGDLKKDSGDKKKGSGDKKEGYDKREAKFHAFEKEIWGAVKAGKLSKEDAMKKLTGLKKEIWGGDLKKDSGDKKKGYDKREAKFNALEKEIWGAVKAGKLSKENAMKKLEGLKKDMFDDHGKKDWDGKKGRDGKSASNIEVLKRQLEALKRENEGLRKRLEKR